VLFRTFEEKDVHYKGDWSYDSIKHWMSEVSVPLLIEFHEDYIEPIFGEQKDAIILFRSQATADSDSFNKVFEEAAKKYQGKILFVVSDVLEGIQQRLGEFMGMENEKLPTLKLLNPSGNMKKFTYEGDVSSLTVEQIGSFIQAFKDAKLKVALKSQDIPVDEGKALKTLVGKNFN
jgi:hypothetical protein